jgi:alanine racemase
MTDPRSPHRAWVEVDHEAVRHNLARLTDVAAPARIIGVVKANAYGHGAVAVARTLRDAGVGRLAVATVDEARALRAAEISEPLLLLWGIGPAEAAAVVELSLEATVYDRRGIDLLESAAQAAGVRASVQLKLDSGLGRQGSEPDEAVELAGIIARSRHLRLAGTFSHLAVPGEDDAYTEVQLMRLARLLDTMRSAGIDPGIVHVSATGGILSGAGSFADAVRPGLGLYGLLPSVVRDQDPGLVPALSVKALPLRLHDLPAGEAIGYGLRHRARRASRIATLGIGYGDGWPRVHANNGWALVRGVRVPIVGAISMDGLMVDISEVDGVTYADQFVLIGSQGSARITADDVATERRTINYEVTTALRDRLPRLHLGTG